MAKQEIEKTQIGPYLNSEDNHIWISIPFEEYKELLVIKGRYEELKSQQTNWKVNRITYKDYTDKPTIDPRKVTCATD